jgi:head-tail adaptor
MRIGDLRERVTITEATANTDAMGQRLITFGTPFSRWAQVEQQPSGEEQAYDGTKAKRRITVVLRNEWAGGKLWDEQMRVTWRAATWDVVSVRELDAQRTWLELTAERLL